ncbi:MAG: gliding motility-associated protein GldE [Bacteroidota bacterium]
MDSDPSSSYTLAFFPILLIVLLVSLPTTIGAVFAEIILLICSALVSGTEVAFFSLTHNDFAQLRTEDTKQAHRILRLKEKPRTLLATILISNNFINIAIVLVSDYLLRTLLPADTFQVWAQTLIDTGLMGALSIDQISRGINFLISIVGVTFLLVLFGETAPKIYAKLNNVRLAKFMAAPLIVLMNVFNPLSRLLVRGTNVIEERLASRNRTPSGPSRQDIDEAIELTVRHEQDANEEIDILKSIVKFGEVTVKQIMRSRVDVIALGMDDDFKDILQVAQESGYSRLPVYEEDIDAIKGILYVKDLIAHLDEPEDFAWQNLIRTKNLFVPESKKINEMLREFQTERMHMAIVVDEYGGTSGIVTLEDILEEVIGEIRDEFDEEDELEYQQLDNFNFVFEGKTLLNDVCRVISFDTNFFDEIRGDADSLAGLVLELAGRIPKKDAEFYYNDFTFRIVSVNKRRIEQIKVTIPH